MTWIQLPDQRVADTVPANIKTRLHHSLIRKNSLIREIAFPTHPYLIRSQNLIRLFIYKFSQQICCIKIQLPPITIYQKISMCGHHAPNIGGDRCNLIRCSFTAFLPFQVLNHLLYRYVIIGLSGTNDEMQFVEGVYHE